MNPVTYGQAADYAFTSPIGKSWRNVAPNCQRYWHTWILARLTATRLESLIFRDLRRAAVQSMVRARRSEGDSNSRWGY